MTKRMNIKKKKYWTFKANLPSWLDTIFLDLEAFCFVCLFVYLFIYLWLCWVFVSVRGPSPVAASGGHSSSRCSGLSLSRPLLLRSTGSRCAGSVIVAHGPSLLCGTWDPPRPGLEPVSPALAGRLSTAAPPGKPGFLFFISSVTHRKVLSIYAKLNKDLLKFFYVFLLW